MIKNKINICKIKFGFVNYKKQSIAMHEFTDILNLTPSRVLTYDEKSTNRPSNNINFWQTILINNDDIDQRESLTVVEKLINSHREKIAELISKYEMEAFLNININIIMGKTPILIIPPTLSLICGELGIEIRFDIITYSTSE